MAIIQQIRNKYGKITVGLIVLALLGFILMDASGRFGDMFGRNTTVVKVNGEKIDIKEYTVRMKEFETLFAMYSKQGNDENTRAQQNQEALKMMVTEKLVGEQCDKLGMVTSKEEEKELIYGSNPDQMVSQFQLEGQSVFKNPDNGMFEPQRIKEFEKQIKQIDPNGTRKFQEKWDAVKSYVTHNNRINKFNFMLMNGTYSPKFLAQAKMKDQDAMAGIRFVKIPFTVVPDNEVKVTDEDIKAYMQKHAAQYTNENVTRSIDYVTFEIKPSKEDTDRTFNLVNQFKADFAGTKDEQNFVNGKSDAPYQKLFQIKKSIQSVATDSITNLPVNAVYGPYFEYTGYKLTKLLERKEMPDSVKCRHILIQTKKQGQEVKADSIVSKRMDSIVTAIKAGANFDSLCSKYSDDDGSNKKGGEYWFSVGQRGNLSIEFGDFIYEGKTGDKKTVKVSNDNYSGYHYIEILEQKNTQPVYRFAHISKELFPGQNTINIAYSKATSFAGQNATAQAFDQAVKKDGLNKKLGENIKINDFTIPGIGASREIVRWMYEAKEGDVSNVFSLEGKYIVAKISGIHEKGLQAITAENRPSLEAAVRSEKKAETLMNKYKSMGSLEAIASAAGQQVQNADSLKLGDNFVPNLGFAPKVIGYAFNAGFAPNKLSPAIKEQEGIYFIMVNNRWSKNIDMASSADQARQQAESQLKNAVGQGIPEILTKKAKIEYTANNL